MEKKLSGTLGNVHRIVARQQLKDRVKYLEGIISTHKPLMQAMQVTQQAFQQGVTEGIRQVAAAEREREQKEKEVQQVNPEVAPSPEMSEVSLTHAQPCDENDKGS